MRMWHPRGPRAPMKKTPPLHVGLWETLSLAMRLAGRLHHPCRSRSPDLDLFGIGRSRTTEVDPMLPVGGTSLSRYEPHRDREVSPTRKPSRYETPAINADTLPQSNYSRRGPDGKASAVSPASPQATSDADSSRATCYSPCYSS